MKDTSLDIDAEYDAIATFLNSKHPRDIPSLFIALGALHELIFDDADELLPAVPPQRAAAMRRPKDAIRARVRALGIPKVTAAFEALSAQTERVITGSGDGDGAGDA
jgi:hypothetical protein